MKILAFEKETAGVQWDTQQALLRDEALHVYELYLSGSLREIYFTEDKRAVLVLETHDRDAARNLLASLTLVKAGMIEFDIMELRPYTGYNRIFPLTTNH